MIALVGLAFALVFWVAAPLGFPFELARHFTPHLAVSAGVLALCGLVLGAKLRGGAAAAAAGLLVWAWVSAPFLAPDRELEGDLLTVAVFNAHNDQQALERAAHWAEAEGVDVIMLAEAQAISPTELETLFARWPHSRTSEASMSVAGLSWSTRSVVFSTWPVRDSVFSNSATQRYSRPVIQLNIGHTDGEIQLTALHPFPPGTPGSVRKQAAMFQEVADTVPDHGRFIVLGDLNTTIWSPNFAKLPGRRAGDPRFRSTFPAFTAVGGIVIDHILIGDALAVTHYEVGPDLGSDHRPVLARMRLIAHGP
ncbi:MAG: endonuclease/exonuclease/phosphatase family protein [Oceanicaulis sp.]